MVNQYGKTNVSHFFFQFVKNQGLYMCRALLAHPQDSLHKRQLVFRMRVMSVGCTKIPSVAGVAPPEDEQEVLETCKCVVS
jgi:hypothetical protein